MEKDPKEVLDKRQKKFGGNSISLDEEIEKSKQENKERNKQNFERRDRIRFDNSFERMPVKKYKR